MKKLMLFAVLLTMPVAGAAEAPPSVEGPDIPPVTEPDHVVLAVPPERFECTEQGRTHPVAIPEGDWDRIILTFTSFPDGDPWDRIFGVSIGGVEVLRGTTPRAPFTLHKDVTEFAALMPPGGEVPVTLYMGSYVGALVGTVSLSFYADEPTGALVRRPRAAATGAFTWRRLTGNGTTLTQPVTFAPVAPAGATIEITLSGHGEEEFWYPGVPRAFRVAVDGTEIAVARSMPYVYALLGFGNANANIPCVGPGTSSTGDTVHPVLWWSAHQALDRAGVHTGNGEIPPYRVEIAAEHLALLTGERTLTVTQEIGGANWVTSVAFLLD